jgi:membrane-associated phospholipid phosphatase
VGACKRGFGMPSSHMVITGIFAAMITMNKDIYLAAAISILEALARYKLHYHTISQIFAGYVLGLVYCIVVVRYLLNKLRLLKKLHLKYKGLLRRIPFLIDDIVVPNAHKS